MLTIPNFSPELDSLLPETSRLIRTASLVLHEAVCQVTLLGSRGLAGGYRTDSDFDLSLMVDRRKLPTGEPERAQLLQAVLQTTLDHWRSPIDVDLAAVFDKGDCCGLRCFNERMWNDTVIRGRGVDCFGIYKIQRGFNGYVEADVTLGKMYPMLVIWRKHEEL